MAQLTISSNRADASALGGDWQRFVDITNTTTATKIVLSRKVKRVRVQADTNDLLVATEGAAGVALDSAAFVTAANVTREVEVIRRPPTTGNTFPEHAIFLQAGTNPTKVSIRAASI